MNRSILCFILFVMLTGVTAGLTQTEPVSRVHEFYPFAGIYAPDRFENSLTVGVSYEFHFDARIALGASVGYANAKQDFYQQVGLPAPEQGSDKVLYYSGRLTHDFPIGGVIPYAIFGVGVTRLHSESNLTFSLGLGTRVPIGKKTYVRYEFSNHIFNSGQGDATWTNNNLGFALGFSFFLQ